MLTKEIREKFLNYFEKNGHRRVPSSPVIPHDDPTLLFINAGMNQFKDVFLGKTKRDYTRAASSQKCVRVGGKHNDLENVGHTQHHLTFFEMLGNFSFGDYFKEEAIRFAWEVTTEVFEFDPAQLMVSVFREDDEAFELWKKYFPEERIVRMDEADNFWEMGDTGPCGPCSELYFDQGAHLSDARSPVEDPEGIRFREFWNLVFMQYNRGADGVMAPLPKPSIDTGAGLERVVKLKMGVESLFETDILRGLIADVETLSGVKYNKQPAFHVIADHLRCLAFAIADGVQPSNVDRGYVLRKVLRRAVRYARTLGMEKPFLSEMLPTLISSMGEAFPQLKSAESRIGELLTIEEEGFLRTLKRGGNILNQIIERSAQSENKISGDDAFKLKDTYGLPLEEIELIAYDADLTVDMDRYKELDAEARERSRKGHKTTQQIASQNMFEQFPPTVFTGYNTTEGEGHVVAIIKDGVEVDIINAGDDATILLSSTPFYAEMGGQVGDTGSLKGEGALFHVRDCQQPFQGVVAHEGKLSTGTLQKGNHLKSTVDNERRQKIANNHTATHVLHWALFQVLGEHVRQAGSVVDDERLRFDFSHHKGVSQEEIRAIEDLVNSKIRANCAVKGYELPYAEVQQREDIKQFFGDKYGETVRVVDCDFSKELCGGTHASSTGNIGYFRIAKESSIAAGVRRIEGVTGAEAETFSRESETLVETVAAALKTQPNKVEERVSKLMEQLSSLEKELKGLQKLKLEQQAQALMAQKQTVGEATLIAAAPQISTKELRPFGETMGKAVGSGVIILAVAESNKCSLLVRVSDDLVGKGVHAGQIIKEIAPLVDGKGGGKADSAQAGGKNPEGIDAALKRAVKLIETMLNAAAS